MKVSFVQVRFRMKSGIALNNFDPSIFNDFSMRFSYLEHDPEIMGILITRPLVVELSVINPKLGTKLDTDFQMYMIL